jgi:DNA-nicking Smr family endonuclease
VSGAERPDENPCRPRDAALWQDAVRGVLPLRRRHPAATPAPAGAILKSEGEPAAAKKGLPQQVQPSLDRLAGIDRATAERLKRGLLAIEARLDLHGMTQVEAYGALREFVRASSAAGRRCLLVITGRGLGTAGPGILKSAVPRWLDDTELRKQILAVASAQPRHGGAGALYVLLRRRR